MGILIGLWAGRQRILADLWSKGAVINPLNH